MRVLRTDRKQSEIIIINEDENGSASEIYHDLWIVLSSNPFICISRFNQIQQQAQFNSSLS